METAIELVAPAYSEESAVRALDAGADAVYCSGERFHAREFCNVGCSLADLTTINEFCVGTGKKYYLVFNAFPSELDWQECVDYLDILMTTSPDVVIVASMGLISWIKEHYSVPITASVLSGTWDQETVQALSELGASAVTISRGAQIGGAQTHANVPLKAVAHGNSCSLLDGTCRLGSYFGGVRGRLTRQCKPMECHEERISNPCRRNYRDFATGRQVLLQHFPVEFCALPLIPKWAALGVTSLKINGRTKSSDWIGKVVSVYRQAVDSYIESPSEWEIKSEWVETLRSLVSTRRLEAMPDPILELSLHEHH